MSEITTGAEIVIREQCGQLIARFLGTYTYCEGVAEDIGYVYLASVPEPIINILIARRPWHADTIDKLLTTIVRREPLDTYDAPPVIKRVGRGRSFDFSAEWRWATRVRNDLAHSTNYGEGSRANLVPRSARHHLRELSSEITDVELSRHVNRLYDLQGGLLELAGYLGLRNYGWEEPGPVPNLRSSAPELAV